MSFSLRVVKPFGNYQAGQPITDPIQITDVLTGVYANYVIQVGTPPTPPSQPTIPPVLLDGTPTTSSASAIGPLGPVIDTLAFQDVNHTFTALPAGASVMFQESPDEQNWSATTAESDPTKSIVCAASPTAPGTYMVESNARYQRLVVTTYTSGTVTVTTQQRAH